MSVLPDHEIARLAVERNMIAPYDLALLQPASYDVRLGDVLLIPHNRGVHAIDLADADWDATGLYDRVPLKDGYLLTAGHFVLGSTVEYLRLSPNVLGRVSGKSSRARVAIQIHSAGFVDPGFEGNLTLEVVNLGGRPVILSPGLRIAQVSFERLESPAEQAYMGRYQGSRGVVGPRPDRPS